MSDLEGGGYGRAFNGGARAGGPTPVVQHSSSGTFRTPRMVLGDRVEREARKKQEAERDRRTEDDDRRRSAERRAALAAPGATSTARDTTSQRRTQIGTSGAQVGSADAYAGRTPLRGAQQAYPTPSTGGSSDEAPARPRGASRAQDETRRGTQQTESGTRRALPSSSGLRQSSAPAGSAQAQAPSTQPSRDAANGDTTRVNPSSFPHAFERWETLSSHWEGLTSYWLHKLESNQEELARKIPSASAMSRQITDLSAAGANLFHAVVELQRLRASSERKFQRWFFETRQEQEDTREAEAKLQKKLQAERAARTELQAERNRAEQSAKLADQRVKEMRRELMISKEEARRAWEELGRREQEERDRTTSLREGMPTVVGGVQVVPMHASAGLSRLGSEGQQPSQSMPPQSDPYQAEQYYGEGAVSPTDTDPFTEGGRSVPPLHHEPDLASLARSQHRPYATSSTPATSGSVQTAIPPTQQYRQPATASARPQTRGSQIPGPATGGAVSQASTNQPVEGVEYFQPTAAEASRFYQQPKTQMYLHSPTQEIAEPDPTVRDPVAATQAARDLRSLPSYTSSVEGTDYDHDNQGKAQQDPAGRPLMYGQGDGDGRGGAERQSETSDDYDVEADVARERELAARYGGARTQLPISASSSAEAMAGLTAPEPPTSGSVPEDTPGYSYVSPDYEGTEYGDAPTSTTTWDAAGTRHHHPTRLSDVPEEEDERASRVSHG